MASVQPVTAMDRLIYVIERTQHCVRDWLAHLSVTFQWQQKWDQTKTYAREHPLVTLTCVISVFMLSLPVSCFLAFAMGSMFFTFMTFMFIEGFLLTVAGVFLGTALFILGFLSLGVSGFLAAAWYTAHRGSQCLSSMRDKIRNHVQHTQKRPNYEEQVDNISSETEEKS